VRRRLFNNVSSRKKTLKKTRQGESKHTRFGSIPDTSHMFVSKKSLKRYKKAYRGQGK
tara:strand:- start:166 stop:339 length:174 start_codon:yes stop_codon:yes gene_type:complete